MLCGPAGRLKGVARQPEEGLQPVRSPARALGALLFVFAFALLTGSGLARAATLHQPVAPVQDLADGRTGPDGAGQRAGLFPDRRGLNLPDGTAVIVVSRARRLVAEAAVAQAILTARPAPLVPCADPGAAGLTLVAARTGGGLELIHIVLRSLRGTRFDLADLP